ncbi:ectoine hydroxylase [Pseudonocardia asaccharolytica]|uniref:Ectoine hydroxylase n=1 Tax=Pseudonocardia asaccharolytica DSM 44247 = NBRC 16224 TaxID=1123024 RepID=A0A511D6U2_9PSEU|nr:ectoine hydroxylase [Pseudonocardia asaccharolytica]GEL20509.1 ectoine dioxygenase [Pseudonocardia asaccharolytica DSM 44247 = NBRC 16224]
MTAVVGSKTSDRYQTRVSATPTLIERTEPAVWGDPAGAGPLDAQDLAAHERDGFVTVPQLLTPEEVGRYVAELHRLATDPAIRVDDRAVIEKTSDEVRSIFEVHKISEVIGALAADKRVAGRARQILGSDVYIHQSRVNYKPGFGGGGFYWHSDFETWHAEDGMPLPRAVSISISLTDNYPYNGCLMIMPGSHKTFVSCVGETPEDHYRESLREQEIGTPDPESLTMLADRHSIAMLTGSAGSATLFDSNCMHGSSDNITPYPRSNIFLVYNSVENALVEPYYAPKPRPGFIAARDFTPVPG